MGAIIQQIEAEHLQAFTQYELSEQQFAQLIGRCRMYRYLPDSIKATVDEIMFGESQINAICNSYYNDPDFCSSPDGNINLWHLYNLFTGANKSTYIDSFLDRSINAFQLTKMLQMALQNKSDAGS